MNSILEKIAAKKRDEINLARQKRPVHSINPQEFPSPRDFIAAIRARQPAVIAEIKKASPSKGIIRADFQVGEIAKTYEQHGASCLSVLTDIHFFQGHPTYIALAKTHSSLPVLRKDFIIDEYQVYESLILGADCILLIVAMLDDNQLQAYSELAEELGLAVLVESHTREELERALKLPTPLIGVNNRNLHSFETNLQCSIELQKYIPEDKIIISESGIYTRFDIELMQSHGINTFLIGESFLRADDPGEALQLLLHHR